MRVSMKKVLFFIMVVFFIGCGSSTNDSGENVTVDISTQNISQEITYSKVVAYINDLRQKAGEIALKEDKNLTTAALNHANYLYINNTTGHYEDENKPGFTGVTPTDRALNAGYFSRYIRENVSSGQKDYISSVDGLFSAIYHRFAFLSTSIDNIGAGIKETRYVYDMGNSLLNTLCQKDFFESSGVYYYDVCKDESLKIPYDDYNGAFDSIRKQNADIILWPYKNATDIPPAFFEEDPDPLPDYSVSGYPVSVEFNRYYFDDNITLVSFKLYDSEGEITDTRIFDKSSDPNHMFSDYQFALFPLQRLDWNTTYSVEFVYSYKGKQYSINWKFKTKDPGYPVYKITSSDGSFYIKNNQTYAFYFVPLNGDDVIKSYSYSYVVGDSVSSSMLDANTILVRVDGKSGDEVSFSINSGDKKLVLIIE
jgi:hypothetical protein